MSTNNSVIGSSLLGNFQLNNGVINNVEDAFIDVDTRIINNSNSITNLQQDKINIQNDITSLENSLITTNNNVNLKLNITDFDSNLSNLNTSITNLQNDKLNITTANTLLNLKTDVATFDSFVSTNTNNLNAKANILNPSFNGTITIPTHGNLVNKITTIDSAVAIRAPLTSPSFNGIINIPTHGDLVNKITAIDTSIGLKAPLTSPTFLGTISIPTHGNLVSKITAIDADISSRVLTSTYTANNTTINNSISTKVNTTTYDINNTNIANSIATKVNITDYNTNNTSISNSIATKVNITDYNTNNVNVSNALGLKANSSNSVLTGNASAFNLTVSNNLVVQNLQILGESTVLNTNITTTDQFAIENDGTGPALLVKQTGMNSVAEFYDDNILVFKIADNGKVGINTATPAYDLDVNGTIKTTNLIIPTYGNLNSHLLLLDGEIDNKLSISDYNTSNELKADLQYVDDQLLLKEDVLMVDEKLTLKSDKTELDLLSDAVDTKLLLKEDITTNNTKLLLKADKTYVDSGVALLTSSKASIEAVEYLGLTKADKTYVDSEILNAITIPQGGYHNSIKLTTFNYSDSFDVFTDNVNGEIEAHVSLANAFEDFGTLVRDSPFFSSANTIVPNSNWGTATGWAVSASSQRDGGAVPFFAFNNNSTDLWESAGGSTFNTAGNAIGAPTWLQIKFPTPQCIRSYRFTNEGFGTQLLTWKLQASNDGITFSNIQDYSSTSTGSNTTVYYDVNNGHLPHMYWRLLILSKRPENYSACRVNNVVFTTGAWMYSVGAVKTLNVNSFRIILLDQTGNPINTLSSSVIADWKFNIMVTKGGRMVSSGLYRFYLDGTRRVIEQISPSTGTISTMDALGEGDELPEPIIPAPVGSIIMFAGLSAPNGYAVCNGLAISRTIYSDLFSKIGILWGSGDGSTTFNIPDLTDRFIRCAGPVAGEVATFKGDAIKTHTHTATVSTTGNHNHTGSIATGGSHGHSTSQSGAGGHSHEVPAVQNSILGNSAGFVYRAGMQGLGNYNTNNISSHTHSTNINSGGSHSHGLTVNNNGNHTHTVSISETGTTETRPMYASVMYAIKF